MHYLETFAHTVGVMQTATRSTGWPASARSTSPPTASCYAEVRFAPELSTAGGLPIEAVVEAMVDGFATGSAEATAAGTPIRVGALLCAMRQTDRWEEVAGLVVRYRDAGVVGFDLAGPEIGFPPDRIPAAIALLDRAGAHRTIHAGEAAGIDSIRAALDGAARRAARARRPDRRRGRRRRRARARWRSGCSTSRCRWRSRRRPTCRPAPTRRWPSTRSTGCTGWASPSRVNTDNRLMSGVSATSELADVATHVRLDLGRRPDGDRACAGGAPSSSDADAGAAARPTSSGRVTPPCGADGG